MAYKELFFAQVFAFDKKNRLIAGRIYRAASAEEAKRKACRLADVHIGTIAFSQNIDEQADDAQEPILLAYHGSVPPEAMADAA